MKDYRQFVEFLKSELPENAGIFWKTSRQGSLIDIQGSLYAGFNKEHFLGMSVLSLFPALLLDNEAGVYFSSSLSSKECGAHLFYHIFHITPHGEIFGISISMEEDDLVNEMKLCFN